MRLNQLHLHDVSSVEGLYAFEKNVFDVLAMTAIFRAISFELET